MGNGKFIKIVSHLENVLDLVTIRHDDGDDPWESWYFSLWSEIQDHH